MSVGDYYGGNQVVSTVLEFLTTDGGNTLGFNAELEFYRTKWGISVADLPIVLDFHGPWILGGSCTVEGVNCGVEWGSSGPEDDNNSRMITHSLTQSFYVPVTAVGGDPLKAFQAGLHYVTVMRGMLMRATYPGTFGYTLNNGGTIMPKLIDRAIAGDDVMGQDQSQIENFMPLLNLSVRVISEYPGA